MSTLLRSGWLALGLGLMVVAIPACMVDTDDDDEVSSSAGYLTVSSVDTTVLLAFVNDTRNDKAEFVNAGLANPAAAALVTYRAGEDAIDGTSDDVVFRTVADVDAVPGIGAASIKKLIAYAKTKALDAPSPIATSSSDPFDDASCSGTSSLTKQEISRKFEPGQSSVNLGRAVIKIQNRRCDPLTGCSAWEDAKSPLEIHAIDSSKSSGEGAAFPISGSLSLQSSGPKLSVEGSSSGYFFTQECSWKTDSGRMSCEAVVVRNRTGKWRSLSGMEVYGALFFGSSKAFMGERCYRFVSRSANANYRNAHFETRFGILARF